MSVSAYLDQLLKANSMSQNKELLAAYIAMWKQIKEALEEHFNNRTISPVNSGSLAKNTAVACKFDYDIVVPFKKKGNGTLEAIYKELEGFLRKDFKVNPQPKIRVQKVSFGLTFTSHGQKLYFDVSPGREVNDFLNDGELNLFVNQPGEGQPQHITTNIRLQINHIKSNTQARDCIRLLKIWKHKQEVQVKSFLLELLAIRAFEYGKVAQMKGLSRKLTGIIEYYNQQTKHQQLKLPDPGFSGNNVLTTLNKKQIKQLNTELQELSKALQSVEMIKALLPL